MTSATARRIGALDRASCAWGKGRSVLLDPDTLQDTATYENPRSYPIGIHYVAVNGVLVVDEAGTTGEKPGRGLTRPLWPTTRTHHRTYSTSIVGVPLVGYPRNCSYTDTLRGIPDQYNIHRRTLPYVVDHPRSLC